MYVKARIKIRPIASLDTLFIVALIVCGGSVFGPCFVAVLYGLLVLQSP